ncbi:hypothetical protein AgCh_027960 [Apium graveolens]
MGDGGVRLRGRRKTEERERKMSGVECGVVECRIEYDLEDSKLKFLLAFPEKWDFKVTSIRDNYQLDITPLDEIYGVLKTHELEMEQMSKRKGSKAGPVTLKVEEKPEEKARMKSYSKGKAMIAKSDTESSNSDDDSNPDTESDIDSDQNNSEDMDQMVALLVKSFKKMVYRNFKKGRRFSKKVSVHQTLIRGTTEEILIGRKLDLENLTSQKRDVTTVMDLDTL